MLRKRARDQARRRQQAQRATAVERDLPLPLRGVFTQARTAGVSNLYAAELLNMRSNGVSLTLRPGVEWAPEDIERPGIRRRIPYEFGGANAYIEVGPHTVTCGPAIYSRAMSDSLSWATNSDNLILADGNGQPLRFTGSTFLPSEFTVTGTGITPDECDGIISHHDRVYLWKVGGPLEFLFGDVGGVTGPMQRFPLGRLGNVTGGLLAMVSLTLDAGHGMNDVLCIITTTGQMLFYEGLDPGDSGDWRLNARVQGARPLGQRAIAQVGADAWMLTKSGPVSIGEAIRGSILALTSEVSRPISDEISRMIEQYPDADWQVIVATDGSMAVISMVSDNICHQFNYWLESRAWTTSDIPARDWHNLAGRLQLTRMDGRLGNLMPRGSDEWITARWVSSWFSTGRDASIRYIKPTIISDGPVTVRAVVLSDNEDRPADIAEAEQIVTMEPEETGGGRATLSDIIPTDAAGSTFQITLEVTARWAEITGMKVAVGS